jgi:tetratricopeptide (TPR) repeat protein
MTTSNKYFSKHFFRNVFIGLLVLFAFGLFIYKNPTMAEASLLRLSILIDPQEGYSDLADLYLENGKPESAIKVLVKACKADPAKRGVYLAEMGHIYITETGDLEKGIKALDEAFKVNPNENWYYCFSISNAYLQTGRKKEAIDILRKANEIESDEKEIGQNKKYIQLILKAVESKPEILDDDEFQINEYEFYSYLILADALYDLGSFEEAIFCYNKAIRLVKVFQIDLNFKDTIYNNLGVALGKFGNCEEEIEAYKRAIELNPDDPITHYNLGKTYIEIGNQEAAMQQYEILKTQDEELAAELWELINKSDSL